jgi:hypothetical protein
VTVESNDIYFEPAELTISADTDVTISLPNAGAAPHNFSIDELGISVDIASGATEETTISAPAGTYEYYCNVPGHKQAGMVGTLIISKDAAAAPAGATPIAAAAEQDAAGGDATPTSATTQATPAAGEEQSAGAGAGRMREPPDRVEPAPADSLQPPSNSAVQPPAEPVRTPSKGMIEAPSDGSVTSLPDTAVQPPADASAPDASYVAPDSGSIDPDYVHPGYAALDPAIAPSYVAPNPGVNPSYEDPGYVAPELVYVAPASGDGGGRGKRKNRD